MSEDPDNKEVRWIPSDNVPDDASLSGSSPEVPISVLNPRCTEFILDLHGAVITNPSDDLQTSYAGILAVQIMSDLKTTVVTEMGYF